jgi:hypothetical protein
VVCARCRKKEKGSGTHAYYSTQGHTPLTHFPSKASLSAMHQVQVPHYTLRCYHSSATVPSLQKAHLLQSPWSFSRIIGIAACSESIEYHVVCTTGNILTGTESLLLSRLIKCFRPTSFSCCSATNPQPCLEWLTTVQAVHDETRMIRRMPI